LRYFLVLAAVVAFLSEVPAVSSGERPTPPNPAAADLIAAEKRFAEALAKADVAVLDKVVSDDWIIIGPDGRTITKSTFLDVVRSGVLKHSTMESDETRMRIYGDAAITTARVVTTGAYQGQAFTTTERATDIYVRDQGSWKCVLTQLTTISAK
jgi:ketosteroid isomerase-like protein